MAKTPPSPKMWDQRPPAVDRGLAFGLGVLAAGALFAVGRSENPGPLGFRLDDAWIHMVYGRELLQNGFLAYNDGVPSTGCTAPLWAAFVAAAHALFGAGGVDRVVGAVLTLGVALHGVVTLAAQQLAFRASGHRPTALGAAVLVALATPCAAAALSGMEVTLAAALLLLGVEAALARRPALTGVWLGLAFLTRPEAAVVGVITFAHLLAARPRGTALAPWAGRFLAAPAAVGTAWIGWNLFASGRPLPATFYAKSSVDAVNFLARVQTAWAEMLPAIPPFTLPLAWIALLGLPLAVRAGFGPRGAGWLPLAAGAGFVLTNLTILNPVDPAAFYHERYLLPGVPLLLVALATGAFGFRAVLPAAIGAVPAALLGVVALIGAMSTVGPESRHLHNDVRNINEVQRTLGEQIATHVAREEWVATSDAGAIRYFGDHPTLDVIGLNVPEMLAPTADFLRAHPVRVFVFLPSWFDSPASEKLAVVARAETANYTVTSFPAMARQVVVQARPIEGDANPAPAVVTVPFFGFRGFALSFLADREVTPFGRRAP